MKKYIQICLLSLLLAASATTMAILVGHAIAAVSINHPYLALAIGFILLMVIPAGYVVVAILDYLDERKRKKWWDEVIYKDSKTRLAHHSYYEKGNK